MTVIAGIAAGDMGWVFANRSQAVVARTARANDLGVINGHNRCKYIGRVAILADIGRINVPDILAGCLGAIVAAYAVAHDIQVVEIRRHPAKRAVTVVAAIATGDMSRILAGRCRTVMAGTAGADDLRMINGHCRREDIRCMTVFTHIRGLDMRGSLAGCVNAVVATNTISHDIHMIEIGR